MPEHAQISDAELDQYHLALEILQEHKITVSRQDMQVFTTYWHTPLAQLEEFLDKHIRPIAPALTFLVSDFKLSEDPLLAHGGIHQFRLHITANYKRMVEKMNIQQCDCLLFVDRACRYSDDGTMNGGSVLPSMYSLGLVEQLDERFAAIHLTDLGKLVMIELKRLIGLGPEEIYHDDKIGKLRDLKVKPKENQS